MTADYSLLTAMLSADCLVFTAGCWSPMNTLSFACHSWEPFSNHQLYPVTSPIAGTIRVLATMPVWTAGGATRYTYMEERKHPFLGGEGSDLHPPVKHGSYGII